MKLPCHSRLKFHFIKSVSFLYNKRFLVICCLLFSFFCTPVPGQTQPPHTRLDSIIVSHKNKALTCRMGVEGIFREKINKAIFSGIPVSFSFYVKLYRIRSLWPDKKIIARQAVHTIKYNALKNNFTVTRSWNRDTVQTVQSFEEARQLMQQTRELEIIELESLTRGATYKIDVMGKMNRNKRPVYLKYLLFFIDFDNFTTRRQTILFTHL